MIIFQATKYLILDMCMEKFFHNIHKNITLPGKFGVNVDEIVDTYIDDFLDFLYGEVAADILIDSKIVKRFLEERVGMSLEQPVIDAITDKFIEAMIAESDPYEDDEAMQQSKSDEE